MPNTRYFIRPGQSRVAWTSPTLAELDWLHIHGYCEVDESAYRCLRTVPHPDQESLRLQEVERVH
jgi:hypothetical protein